jgi:N-acetylglutamate synthase-like GNAT family acetyltransferase
LGLDEFVEYLAMDGKWHSLSELIAFTRLSEEKVEKIAQFFARYGFIQFDEAKRRVKIDHVFRKIILSTLELEKKAPVIILKGT